MSHEYCLMASPPFQVCMQPHFHVHHQDEEFYSFHKTIKLLLWAASLMQLHHSGTDVCDIFDPNLFFFFNVFALPELCFSYKCFSSVKTPTFVSWSTECSVYAQQRSTFNKSWMRQHMVWGLRFRFGMANHLVSPFSMNQMLNKRCALGVSEPYCFSLWGWYQLSLRLITDQRGCKLSHAASEHIREERLFPSKLCEATCPQTTSC